VLRERRGFAAGGGSAKGPRPLPRRSLRAPRPGQAPSARGLGL